MNYKTTKGIVSCKELRGQLELWEYHDQLEGIVLHLSKGFISVDDVSIKFCPSFFQESFEGTFYKKAPK